MAEKKPSHSLSICDGYSKDKIAHPEANEIYFHCVFSLCKDEKHHRQKKYIYSEIRS